MRARTWAGRDWVGSDMRARMTFLGRMWGFEMGARVSEYTTPESGAVDHCASMDDLVFVSVSPCGTRSVYGSQLAESGLVSPQLEGRVSWSVALSP